MAMSDAERYKKWRRKQSSLGRKPLTVILSRDARHKLDKERERTGDSIAKIIERALINLGTVASKSEQLNDKPTVASQPLKVASKRLRAAPVSEAPADETWEFPNNLPMKNGLDLDLLEQVKAGPGDPEREKIEATLKQLRAKGLSFQNIADYMNQKDIPTMSGKGVWRQGAINKLLKKAGVS
jgi:hypothetical protein